MTTTSLVILILTLMVKKIHKMKTMRTDGSTPRKSYWTMIREPVKTKLDARIWTNKPTELLIVNPNKFTKIGNQVGYRLVPDPAAIPLILEYD